MKDKINLRVWLKRLFSVLFCIFVVLFYLNRPSLLGSESRALLVIFIGTSLSICKFFVDDDPNLTEKDNDGNKIWFAGIQNKLFRKIIYFVFVPQIFISLMFILDEMFYFEYTNHFIVLLLCSVPLCMILYITIYSLLKKFLPSVVSTDNQKSNIYIALGLISIFYGLSLPHYINRSFPPHTSLIVEKKILEHRENKSKEDKTKTIDYLIKFEIFGNIKEYSISKSSWENITDKNQQVQIKFKKGLLGFDYIENIQVLAK